MAALPFEKTSVAAIPRRPGVYVFSGEKAKVLYVGKAVDLRSRVRSYFGKSQDARIVTQFLHRFATGIDYVVTDTEKDALLLENSLIKKHAPRFNVRLRDDKTYFSLRIDLNAEWPWFTIVRRRVPRDGVLYFGPYPSASACRRTLQFLGTIFPLRTCTDAVLANRTRPCIAYEIKRCVAPCVGYVDRDAYMVIVDQAIAFLKGRNQELIRDLEEKMRAASERMDFETAASLRDRIQAIETTIDRPRVTANVDQAFDVVGLHRGEDEVQVAVLFVRDGLLASTAAFRVEAIHDTDELLRSFLGQFYTGERVCPAEVILPEECGETALLEEMLSDQAGRMVKLVVPERGEKLRLLRLAQENAELAWRRRHEDEEGTRRTLAGLRHQLELRRIPRRIECFDVSNLMGRHVVGSCAAFLDGRPDKARYRRYKIRSFEGQDDFAGMAEILRRRLARGQREGDLPDLVVIDGGKGQLAAAVEAATSLGLDDLDVVALAKARDARVGASVLRDKERLFKPGSNLPIVLDQNSEEMKLLMRVRDEAHRFAITYHRRLRAKAQAGSALEMIPGIGRGRARALLRTFGSVRGVREADDAALLAIRGVTPDIVAALRAFFASAGHLESDLGAREDDDDA